MTSSSLKRAFDASDPARDEEHALEGRIDPTNHSKRNKNDDPVENMQLIPEKESWRFDITGLLSSPTTIPTVVPGQLNGNNSEQYDPSKSLFILCIIGEMTSQFDFLCSIYTTLTTSSPNLQILVLTNKSKAVEAALARSPISLPIIEAQGYPSNHFLKLGLLHPLGGGQQPLDAIVIIDTMGRRRLVLPFGWGAGRHVDDPTTGGIVQQRLKELLVTSVRELEGEQAGQYE